VFLEPLAGELKLVAALLQGARGGRSTPLGSTCTMSGNRLWWIRGWAIARSTGILSSTRCTMACTMVVGMVDPPEVPMASSNAPSGAKRKVGAMEESGTFPGAGAFSAPPRSP